MPVIATCGHELTEKEGLGITVAIKEFDKFGDKIVSYPTLCAKCLKKYKKRKLILNSQEEIENWFKPLIT
jgi:hypothetical protein